MSALARLASNVLLTLRGLLWVLLLPGVIAGFVPWRYFGLAHPRVDFASPVHLLGVLAIAAGAVLLAACVWEFASRGRGTLSPVDPPRALVVRGPYRWVRNPMYVGVLAALAGEVLLVPSRGLAGYWATVCVGFNLFVLGYEEPWLAARFGTSYEEYRRRVGRWMPRRPMAPSPRPGC